MKIATVKIILSAILQVIFFIGFSQSSTLDSLKQQLLNAKYDSTKLRLRGNIGEESLIFRLSYWDSLNVDAKKIKDRKVEGDAVNNIGRCYKRIGDITKALEYYHASLSIREAISDKKGIAESLNNIALVFSTQGEIQKALEYNNRSLKIREEIKEENGIASSFNNIGAIYYRLGKVSTALDFYHKSLKIREKIQDKQGTAESLNNIGSIYKSQDEYAKALEYYLKSLKIRELISDKKGIAVTLNNIGTVYIKKAESNKSANGKEDINKLCLKAINCYTRSLFISEEIGDKSTMSNCLNNLGFLYSSFVDNSSETSTVDALKLGDTKALNYYQRSLKIKENLGDKLGIANTLNSIANLKLKRGELLEAISLAKNSMKIGEKLGYPQVIKISSTLLKNIFEKQNKFKEAFEMFKLEVKMRDSVSNDETQKESVRQQMQYAFEKTEMETRAEQEKKDAIAIEELNQKQKERNYFIVGFVLVMVLALIILRSYLHKQKANKIITEQKLLVEEKHKEITDSINYAERIQSSFLATKTLLDENLLTTGNTPGDYFILFKPKDIVSGDFYWAGKLSNGNFAMLNADSTGHGVPGAIMSILNISSLEKAVENETEPDKILNKTRKIIIERLKKDGSIEGGKDGMDCSLIILNKERTELYLSAANNSLFIVRSSLKTEPAELLEFKADKMPVGKHDKDHESFTKQTAKLYKGDVIYTLTDGFSDQFGGENGKKFMIKNVKKLFLEIAHLPMQEQKQKLLQTFLSWKAANEQVDDLCVVGVRI